MTDQVDILEINSRLFILMDEIGFSAVRASGPGGQHVNKTNTAIQLSWNSQSSKIPEWAKMRIRMFSDQRVSRAGVITIKAQTHRSQKRNREEALTRLKELIEKAIFRPKPRRKTRPSKGAVERRIKRKKIRSDIKRHRQRPYRDN